MLLALAGPATVARAQQPGVLLDKSDDVDPVTTGSVLTYTVVATNNWTDPINDMVIQDTLPAGTTFVSANSTRSFNCQLSGATLSCTITELVNPTEQAVLTIQVSVVTSTGPLTNAVTGQADDINGRTVPFTPDVETTAVLGPVPAMPSAAAVALLAGLAGLGGLLARRLRAKNAR